MRRCRVRDLGIDPGILPPGAAVEATEEAINGLTMAETMSGFKARMVEALDLDMLREAAVRQAAVHSHRLGISCGDDSND